MPSYKYMFMCIMYGICSLKQHMRYYIRKRGYLNRVFHLYGEYKYINKEDNNYTIEDR